MSHEVGLFEYYDAVSSEYDELWGFAHAGWADVIIKELDIQPNDNVAEIGAGTGALSEIIWKKVGLVNPILAVEPSAGQLERAKTRHCIKPMLATAEEFVQHKDVEKYNKVFFSHSAHFVPNFDVTIKALCGRLSPGSKCLLLLFDKNCDLLLWRSAQEAIIGADQIRLVTAFNKAEFTSTTCKSMVIPRCMTKAAWYQKLRNRIFAYFRNYSDEEIEKGIAELEQSTFNNTNTVELNYTYTVLVGNL